MKCVFSILLLVSINANMSVYGQLNPVSDLYYEQTYWYGNYNCPAFNCFELSWTRPDPSNDTLLGYMVYKDGECWVFTENTDVNCLGYSQCEYSDFLDGMPFWVSVKAVYNRDSALSVAYDSIYVATIWVSVEEFDQEDIIVFKNPISAGENISILFPDTGPNSLFIKIYSLGGQLQKDIKINDHNGGLIHFSSTNLNPGIYIINILSGNKVANRKILIE